MVFGKDNNILGVHHHHHRSKPNVSAVDGSEFTEPKNVPVEGGPGPCPENTCAISVAELASSKAMPSRKNFWYGFESNLRWLGLGQTGQTLGICSPEASQNTLLAEHPQLTICHRRGTPPAAVSSMPSQ